MDFFELISGFTAGIFVSVFIRCDLRISQVWRSSSWVSEPLGVLSKLNWEVTQTAGVSSICTVAPLERPSKDGE